MFHNNETKERERETERLNNFKILIDSANAVTQGPWESYCVCDEGTVSL